MRVHVPHRLRRAIVSRAIEEYARGPGPRQRARRAVGERPPRRSAWRSPSVKGEGWAIEHTNLGTIRLTDLGHDTTRVAIVAARAAAALGEAGARGARSTASRRLSVTTQPQAGRPRDATRPRRLGRDVRRRHHACASRKRASRTSVTPSRGCAPADLARIGARPGDVLKITGRHGRPSRAPRSSDDQDRRRHPDRRHGCAATAASGLQEQVTVARRRSTRRRSPCASRRCGWAPRRRSSRPSGCSRIWPACRSSPGCVVRVPTFAKAVNFQVVRTIPVGPGGHRAAHRHPRRRRRADRRRARRRCPTRTSAASSAKWRACAKSSSCR